MNPKANLQNQLEILQAVKDGKPVRWSSQGIQGVWHEVHDDHIFNFHDNDYAIVKTKSTRPWTYEEIVVGRAVKHKKINRESIIISKCENAHVHLFAVIGSDVVSPQHLLEDYETIDGTPCGVEV